MYYVTYKDESSLALHIGDKQHQFPDASEMNSISEIQADGHELVAIKNRFSDQGGYTIPMPNSPVCRWYGDLARTIHINMVNGAGFGL